LGFILRFVLILLVFAFVVYVLKAIARLSHHLRGTIRDVREIREKMSPAVSANMVRCLSCGAFVSPRDAVTVSYRNNSQTFCSSECARAHVSR
jgi:MoxR-like ATPase